MMTMNRMHLDLSVSLLGLLAGAVGALAPLPTFQHTGMCDASAAVAVGTDLFVVASDEDNVLRTYRSKRGGGPVASFPLDDFLGVEPEHPEADIEGAARVGDRIYWITSHGRNKNAKKRPNRRRRFATEVRVSDVRATLVGVGVPYRDLLKDLENDPDLDEFKLDQAAEKAPEDEDGLNIEGLAATPRGHLLIGFRNPIRKGQALLVSLENPDEVIHEKRAKLGKPIALDLGKRGVRGDGEFTRAPPDPSPTPRSVRHSRSFPIRHQANPGRPDPSQPPGMIRPRSEADDGPSVRNLTVRFWGTACGPRWCRARRGVITGSRKYWTLCTPGCLENKGFD
jgi:uncharacterized protein DUF3616